jgi:hypothetical protein
MDTGMDIFQQTRTSVKYSRSTPNGSFSGLQGYDAESYMDGKLIP